MLQNSAADPPATKPVLQHPIKLKPPVTPSTSKTSPAMNKPGRILLSMLVNCTSFKKIPPAVTNSSLKLLKPVVFSGNDARLFARERIIALEASPQTRSGDMDEWLTSAAQRRFGMIGAFGVSLVDVSSFSSILSVMNNGQPVATRRLGIKRVISHKASIKISSLPPVLPSRRCCSSNFGQKCSFTSQLYLTAWNSLAANADKRNVAGPEIPWWVMSRGPSCVMAGAFFFRFFFLGLDASSLLGGCSVKSSAEGGFISSLTVNVSRAVCTDNPARPWNVPPSRTNSLVSKVNSDGTGLITLCPNERAISCPIGNDPVASMSASKYSFDSSFAAVADLEETLIAKLPLSWLLLSSESIHSTLCTFDFVRTSTPALMAACVIVSMIVCELSVTGNILPSLSVLSSTPLDVNQSYASSGVNRFVYRPRNSLFPLG
mmetsp:Transcript_5616/g.11865  ORF Transcript_5616/g.11865 Transcript_5616/m.11865 type:complete len:432 (+) Transcript_5616:41-1336(+)